MLELKHISVLRCAVVTAVLYCLGGLIEAVVFGAMMAWSPAARGPGPFPGMAFFVVAFPIFGAVGGFVFGAVGAALYNVVARWTGGLQLTFAREPEERLV